MKEIEAHLGYRFRDESLIRLALTHRSHANERGGLRADNQRLEFLGDAILGLLVSEELFRRYPTASEGDLSSMRARLVNESSLADHARRLGIGTSLLLGKGEDRSGGREKDSILADAFEAVIAALYLDGGMDALLGVMNTRVFPFIDYSRLSAGGGDYKTMLQERLQALSRTPSYRTVEVSGPDHCRLFRVEVVDGEVILGRGTGSSRKGAEQDAAREALERLGTDPGC